MAALQSLRVVPSLLRDQPIIFVAVLLFVLLQTPQLFAQSLEPLAAALVSIGVTLVFLFVFPFFHGGFIGMANDAATRQPTSLRRFIRQGRRYYVSLLGAYLLVFAVLIGVGIVVSIGLFVAVLAYVALEGIGGIVLAAGIGLLMVAIYLAVFVPIQFYGHAIVIEGDGAIDGLKRSIEVVRSNLRSVGGYLLVLLAGSLVMGVAYAQPIQRTFPMAEPGEPAPLPSLEAALVGTTGSVLLLTGFGAVYLVYSVVFYRALTVDRSDTHSPVL